ncbi:hypothetical protein ACQKOE_09895 [Novosphingobium sp. NPDC080210]|uniref:hypothetical protein n=1 Tax=Novosphingobium sp. NPDC080210 TaxID=3390596 RepID=UPI003D00A61E
MTASVASQTAYVPMISQGLNATAQTAYAALLTSQITLSSQTAYVAMFEELAPVAKRRRTFIP